MEITLVERHIFSTLTRHDLRYDLFVKSAGFLFFFLNIFDYGRVPIGILFFDKEDQIYLLELTVIYFENLLGHRSTTRRGDGGPHISGKSLEV